MKKETVIERIVGYLKEASVQDLKYDLRKKGNFVVSGACIVEDSPVSHPDSYCPDIGIANGRFIDVVAWAVRQKGFYRDGEYGTIELEEDAKVVRVPYNRSLDIFLK